jgi:hypothetical protein
VTDPDTPPGRLADNILHFARALRRAGVRVGTAEAQAAVQATAIAGFTRKTDFYHTLQATLIHRADDIDTFDRLFALFWRDPEFIEKMIRMMSPVLTREAQAAAKRAADRRATDAMGGAPPARSDGQGEREEITLDARVTFSPDERLRAMDFDQMSAAELAEAEAALRALRLPVDPLRTRRTAPAPRGRTPDLRATLRASLRRGGETGRILMRAPRTRPPDLVAILDISGSMSVYARTLLRFLHALSHARARGATGADWGRVHAFTLGTRLTNVSRALAAGDPDAALAAVGREARDGQGGTRLGDGLHRFNTDWSRRVLTRGAVVLFISDGLERGDPAALGFEAARLARSCRRLIWLNPLLRWDGFAPEAAGIRAILPHVTDLRPCHSLDSLADLTAALSGR